jgi:predicted nucleic acid-binding protein
VSFVLDNSVVMRWYFGDGSPTDLDYASLVLGEMATIGARVPAVWELEVANVLVRAEAQGLTTEARSEAFIQMLSRMDISIDIPRPVSVLSTTLHLARRDGISSYNASYLELAMRENLALATLDSALQAAADRAGVRRFAV